MIKWLLKFLTMNNKGYSAGGYTGSIGVAPKTFKINKGKIK